jgi:hypothetical protein
MCGGKMKSNSKNGEKSPLGKQKFIFVSFRHFFTPHTAQHTRNNSPQKYIGATANVWLLL